MGENLCHQTSLDSWMTLKDQACQRVLQHNQSLTDKSKITRLNKNKHFKNNYVAVNFSWNSWTRLVNDSINLFNTIKISLVVRILDSWATPGYIWQLTCWECVTDTAKKNFNSLSLSFQKYDVLLGFPSNSVDYCSQNVWRLYELF